MRALAKLDQVLPDRLRRRVGAVHANVVPLRWRDRAGPVVDAEALALLSLACRDREQVSFDYERRDGQASSRLAEPHQLVSAGRRWYLVAWDVRRGDWRTYRVDRLARPRLAGVRFPPRALPGGDAAAFVARSLASMPTRYRTEVLVHGPADAVAATAGYVGGDVEPVGDGRCLVTMRGDSVEWLALAVAELAMLHEVELDGPPGLVAEVGRLAGRLTALVADTG